MLQEKPGFELIDFIFGSRAREVQQTAGNRLLRWAHAYADWLVERETIGNRNILSISRCAWRDLLSFRPKLPWEFQAVDIEQWFDQLEQKHLSASTINRRLEAISSFYRFCLQHEIEKEALLDPARNIPRLNEHKYQAANYLDVAEVQSLLGVIDLHQSILGKRDYALILMLLDTGMEVEPVRSLKAGDLGLGKHKNAAHTSDKACRPFRQVVRLAIIEFLEASGRMQELHAQDFVFVALADPLIHAPSGKSSDWKSSRPITQALVRFVLKQYARAAGLDPRRVTCPNLRHTAAVLKLQMGDDVEEIQEFLGRKSQHRTAEYLDKLASTGAPA